MNAPRPVRVRVDARGKPIVVAGVQVETVRRDWLHRFGWWRDDPLRRHYYEVITVTGRRVVVFRDMLTDRWFSQRA
ncbi:MAG: hypothetical protein ACHQC8_01890 [Solirubrobacterales bacterium]